MSIKAVKKKCINCFKRTLFLSECKCGNEYCIDCLTFFNHKCTFDWKSDKKQYLENNNPQILAEKFVKL